MIRKGNLGAARIANNVSRISGNGWDGSNTKMSRWLELPIVADNVAGTKTICTSIYVACCREDKELVLIAGKDLCHTLDYLTPAEQQERSRQHGITDMSWLGNTKRKRKYVLSKDEQEKIPKNRENRNIAGRVLGIRR